MGALAQRVVQIQAPGELPAFGVMREEYFKRGIRLDRSGRDVLLGIGVETVVALLTPVALEVCWRLWESLCAEAAGATVRAGQARAEEVLRRLRSRFGWGAGEEPKVSFTPEHLREVHRHVMQQAGAMGLPEEQQRLMADAVVGALADPDASGRQEPDLPQEPEGQASAPENPLGDEG